MADDKKTIEPIDADFDAVAKAMVARPPAEDDSEGPGKGNREVADADLPFAKWPGKIDLGGVAKGYATAKAQDVLRDGGVVNYWIDAGTSSFALGESSAADGSFNVHYNDLGSSVYTKIKDCAVGTSSYFEQHATVNGQLYSHIVNDEINVAMPGQTAR